LVIATEDQPYELRDVERILVPAILISPQTKSGYKDDTPLSHYSLLRTILIAWKLAGLGFTEKSTTQAITAPWK